MQLLPATLFLGLYLYLNWRVIGQPPYYDEMWKLDLIVSPDTVAEYFAHDTPIPIGWLFLNKLLLYFAPTNFGVARLSCAIWFAIALWLLARRTSATGAGRKAIFGGLLLLAVCLPIQASVHNFNQYSFEILYSVAIVCVASTEEMSRRTRLAALSLIALTPIFSLSSIFFVPGALGILFVTGNRQFKFEIIASSLIACAVAALVYVYWYGPILYDDGKPIVSFWEPYIVKGSIDKFLAVLSSFPGDLAASLLREHPASRLLESLVQVVLLALIPLGWAELWRASRATAWATFSGPVMALVASLLVTWPLAFDINARINLGWLWVIYFYIGVGAAAVLLIFTRDRYFPLGLTAAACAAVLLGPSLTPYGYDRVAFRRLYFDLEKIISDRDSREVIVQFHYMARFYPDFLIKARGAENFAVLPEGRDNPKFVQELPERLAAYSDADVVWFVWPGQRGSRRGSDWQAARDTELPGFRLDRVYRARGSAVARFERKGLRNMR